jgi:hypothetical protein
MGTLLRAYRSVEKQPPLLSRQPITDGDANGGRVLQLHVGPALPVSDSAAHIIRMGPKTRVQDTTSAAHIIRMGPKTRVQDTTTAAYSDSAEERPAAEFLGPVTG